MSNVLLHIALGVLFRIALHCLYRPPPFQNAHPAELEGDRGRDIYRRLIVGPTVVGFRGLVLLGSTWAGNTLIYIHLISVATAMGGFCGAYLNEGGVAVPFPGVGGNPLEPGPDA